MKNYCLLILITFLMMAKIRAQPTLSDIPKNLTPNGMFDTIFGNNGSRYNLADLNLLAQRPLGGSYSINVVPTVSCIAGVFRLFYTGSLFTAGTQSADARGIVCEVFSSLSNFISSPAALGSINILVEDAAPGLVANAQSFHYSAAAPGAGAQGPSDGMVYQYLKSGVDPYSTLPIGNFTTFPAAGQSFYHGVMRFSTAYSWNTDGSITNIGATEYDLAGTCLHEATHLLGFYSLINCNGGSKLSSTGQYSRYDQFLQDYNNNPLLTPITASNCASFSQTFNTALTPSIVLSQSTCPIGSIGNQNVSTCSVAVKYVSANVT